MFNIVEAFQWLLMRRTHHKLYRLATGGLWVHFKNDTWVRCKWSYPHVGTYIAHPQDGGMFSVKFKLIAKIENYPHGHTK